MADAERGRQIFEQRVEYPLPKQTGVRDYIFFLFKDAEYAKPGFATAAQKFLGQHYAHAKKKANTLEDLLAALHADISAGGVTQIRELVLVTHGNAAQLFFPVMKDGPGIDPVYRCVTEYSLCQLQDDIDAGKFASIEQARKDVAAHMLEDSWVTIRACNIGKSPKTLYGLYSLFGGRANVYAPSQYVVFGDRPVGPSERVTTKFGVYDYLVKQHFLATSEHTPGRQAAIVADLLDPESYSMPFVLASAEVSDTNEAQAYQKLIEQLNRYNLTSELRQKFAAADFALSPEARVVKSVTYTTIPGSVRATWFLRDQTVQSDGSSFDLVYEIHDEASGGDGPQTQTLEARARIATLVSSNAWFPFQLFFDQQTDDEFKGIVTRLAGYAEGGQLADQQQKDEFDATEALLDAGSWTDGTIDLTQRINQKLAEAGLDILADPPPAIHPPAAGGEKVWTVGGAQPLVIRREGSKTQDGFSAFSLTAYRALTGKARLQNEHDVLARKGRVPDTPGTELAAYLDRLTLDDLDGLLAYLRANYRAAYAFYVDHAQKAMQRKRDYLTWYRTHVDQQNTVLDDYSILRPGEKDDLKDVAFDFDFNDNWREVKVSSPYVTATEDDLFADEDLRSKLDVQGTWICGNAVPDSPYTSRDDAKAAEVPGNEKYFQSSPDKSLYEPPPAPVDGGCANFKAAIEKWKELRDADTDPEIEKQELEKEGLDGESYYKKIQETLEPFHLSLEVSDAIFGTKIEPYVWITEHLAEHVASEALADALEVGAAVGEYAFVFFGPFEMWLHAAEANLEGVNLSEALGEILAIRLWIYRLADMTVTQVPFPATVSIDVGGEDAFDDAWEEVHARDYPYGDIKYRYSPDDMKRGFVFAGPRFAKIGPEIVVQADKAISERIAALGLDPCRLKVLTDIGLLDLDVLRRKTINGFCQALLEALHKV
jgi:hypothetical protein